MDKVRIRTISKKTKERQSLIQTDSFEQYRKLQMMKQEQPKVNYQKSSIFSSQESQAPIMNSQDSNISYKQKSNISQPANSDMTKERDLKIKLLKQLYQKFSVHSEKQVNRIKEAAENYNKVVRQYNKDLQILKRNRDILQRLKKQFE